MSNVLEYLGIALLVALLVGSIVLLVFAIQAVIVTNKIALECLHRGYQEATVYVVSQRAYCHKMENGTSITVPIDWAGWEK